VKVQRYYVRSEMSGTGYKYKYEKGYVLSEVLAKPGHRNGLFIAEYYRSYIVDYARLQQIAESCA
jgi:hypothetical protein